MVFLLIYLMTTLLLGHFMIGSIAVVLMIYDRFENLQYLVDNLFT